MVRIFSTTTTTTGTTFSIHHHVAVTMLMLSTSLLLLLLFFSNHDPVSALSLTPSALSFVSTTTSRMTTTTRRRLRRRRLLSRMNAAITSSSNTTMINNNVMITETLSTSTLPTVVAIPPPPPSPPPVTSTTTTATPTTSTLSTTDLDDDTTTTPTTTTTTDSDKYSIHTYNKISSKGLESFPNDMYTIYAADGSNNNNNNNNDDIKSSGTSSSSSSPHALLIRSYKLHEDEIQTSIRAIARCGAGTNNIPVSRMTELGIPVFNTPGANANAVKELIICSMLLGSRRIVDGINHMKLLGKQGIAKERVEKDKAQFSGYEMKGKTLSIIGLGNIGALVARDAVLLGMNVQGYDPALSIQSALKLPREISLKESMISAIHDADYVSINIPYIQTDSSGVGGTHGIINKDIISHFKPNTVLLNFARGELVDSIAMKEFLDRNSHQGAQYISDFPDDLLYDHSNVIIIPHLGASTIEAEDCAACMAAETIRDYLESGIIRNSVNFPSTTHSLPERTDNDTIRIAVVTKKNNNMQQQQEMMSSSKEKITDCFKQAGYNIQHQINESRGDISYTVIDFFLDDDASSSKMNHDDDDQQQHGYNNNNNHHHLKELQREITMLNGVLSTRILLSNNNNNGAGEEVYARNIDGQYSVL